LKVTQVAKMCSPLTVELNQKATEANKMSNDSNYIERRRFLQGIAAAGVVGSASLPFTQRAFAANPNQIVYANYGGDTAKCVEDAFGTPFTKEFGVGYTNDGTGPTYGKIKAMIDSGAITWDVVEGDIQTLELLAPTGALEAIDYSIVDKSTIMPEFIWNHGVGHYTYSYVLAYDTSKFSGAAPTSWADFFDTKRYPGKRAMWKWGYAALEAALLADGVAPADVYPLDIPRAIAKLETIKDDLIVWGTGADSQQLFHREEIVMSQMWNGRASVVMKDTNGRVKYTFNQGIMSPNISIILKGNPAGAEWANRFIAGTRDAERQAAFFRCIGYGPTNPAALKLLSDEENLWNPTGPANIGLQIPMDGPSLAKQEGALIDAFLALMGS
jgi:putative spermidine/putrescine transport system substrate-binding protein